MPGYPLDLNPSFANTISIPLSINGGTPGSVNTLVFAAPFPSTLVGQACYIVSAASVAVDVSNNYAFSLYNVTQSKTLVESALTTGNQALTANVAQQFNIFQQNNYINAGDVIRINVTVTGSPTPNLSSSSVILVLTYRQTAVWPPLI